MQKVESQNLLALILKLLDDDEQAASEKFLRIRQSLTFFFEHGKSDYDPGELVDETIDRVALKLKEGHPIAFEPGREGAYFLGVAKNVEKEYRRKRYRAVPLADLPPHQEPSIDPRQVQQARDAQGHRERLNKCLNRCAAHLPDEDRRLIMEYYRGNTGRRAGAESRIEIRKKLADRLGVSLNALQLRVTRNNIPHLPFNVRLLFFRTLAACQADLRIPSGF